MKRYRTIYPLWNSETSRYALAGILFGLLFPLGATILRMQLLALPITISNAITVQNTDPLLWIIDTAPIFLGLFAAIAGRRQDNLKKLYEDLRRQGVELENSHQTLEKRVEERTADLTRRATQLQTIASAARAIAEVQELGSLLSEISKLVSELFGYYHVGIFLLDEAGEFAVLQAANSEGGKRMLSRRHRLRLDNNSIVGYTALIKEPRIALDVGQDSVFFNNPDLPDTHSEMALPLRVGRRIIGVLDVQSREPNAFVREDIGVLEILADQIAVAIENARLYTEARNALSDARTAFEKYVRQEWSKFSDLVRQSGFAFDGKQILPLTDALQRQRLAQTGSLSIDRNSSEISMPIRLRGQTLGILDIRPKNGSRRWTPDELAVVEAAADRAALALENARLVESAQRRAGRERAIGEISARVSAVSDRELILQTAVEELGRKIGNTEIRIEIDVEDTSLQGNR